MYGHPNPDGTRRPPARRIQPRTEQRILTVRPTFDNLAGGQLVDAVGTLRRLHALHAAGWSQAKIAARLGIQQGNYSKILTRNQCTARTARQVAAVYDELWNQPPPTATHYDRAAITRAKTTARLHGWAPPLAWDDDTIDCPEARPATTAAGSGLDEIALQLAMSGDRVRLTGTEKLEAISRLHASGFTWREIERRLGMSANTAQITFTRNARQVAA